MSNNRRDAFLGADHDGTAGGGREEEQYLQREEQQQQEEKQQSSPAGRGRASYYQHYYKKEAADEPSRQSTFVLPRTYSSSKVETRSGDHDIDSLLWKHYLKSCISDVSSAPPRPLPATTTGATTNGAEEYDAATITNARSYFESIISSGKAKPPPVRSPLSPLECIQQHAAGERISSMASRKKIVSHQQVNDHHGEGLGIHKNSRTISGDAVGQQIYLLPPRRSFHDDYTANTRTTEDSKEGTATATTTTSTTISRTPSTATRQSTKPRIIADFIPEVHFLGEIKSGCGFSGYSLTCKWFVDWGTTTWSLLEGSQEGQTQFATTNSSPPDNTSSSTFVWNHPIDLHFTTANMKGWPRIILQVWNLDSYGNASILGYGFTFFPATPGIQEVEVNCWRPKGTLSEEVNHFFLGSSIRLTQERIIVDDAWEKRQNLVTILTGKVKIQISCIMRYFDQQCVRTHVPG
jgi:B9 protein.